MKVGPGAVIGSEVTIEAGCEVGPYTVIEGDTHIGPDNRFFSHVIIGTEPQDLKYKGGGRVVIGRGNTFREFTTLHRGHLSEEGTVVGNDNMFLTGVHIGHDCKIGHHNFLANLAMLAGHCEVGDHANISGHSGFHQFCRIGDHVMISGMSACRQDVPPYAMTQGDPAVVVGINRVGLHRAGWSSSKLTELREAYRCFRNGLEGKGELFDQLEAFREGSQRGIMKFGRAR